MAELDTTVAVADLNGLAGVIRHYDPNLYVTIEDLDDVMLGAGAIARYYGVRLETNMPVLTFCKNVRQAIIDRHGLAKLMVA